MISIFYPSRRNEGATLKCCKQQVPNHKLFHDMMMGGGGCGRW